MVIVIQIRPPLVFLKLGHRILHRAQSVTVCIRIRSNLIRISQIEIPVANTKGFIPAQNSNEDQVVHADPGLGVQSNLVDECQLPVGLKGFAILQVCPFFLVYDTATGSFCIVCIEHDWFNSDIILNA